MAETALMEFLLIIIAVLLSSIGYFLRKSTRKILDRIDSISESQEDQGQEIDLNSVMLYGKEGTPWNGFGNEVKKNRRKIVNQDEQLIRHERALRRENMLSDERYQPEDLNNLEDIFDGP